nr:unnamed protein product [Digitaria exilis]
MATTPSPAAAPAIYTGWALFDPSVIITEEPVVPAGPTAASCLTSDGHDIRVSLRLADPPSASFVEMRTDADLHPLCTPTVVAADGDLLLLLASLADSPSHEHNFFVYKPHPPSLRLLPHPDVYTGIVTRRRNVESEVEEEQEFVAAAFHTELTDDEGSRDEVGKLTRFSSSTGRCEVLNLSIPFDPTKGLYKYTWRTDKVVPFGDLMCFVDYHRGILLCDVFAGGDGGGGSPELRFVPLPEIEVWDDKHNYCYGRGLPATYRTVGVTSHGVMRFVDVSDGLFGRRRDPFGVTITTWTLRSTSTAPEETMRWEKDAVLRLDDLWSFDEFRRSSLPRWVPGLPAVCRHDPDAVVFALLNPKSIGADAWLIMVDLRQMELLSYVPYINQAKGDDAGGESWKVDGCLFLDMPFVCSDLYSFGSIG